MRQVLRGSMNPDGGPLSAADAHQTHPGKLGDLLRKPGVGQVFTWWQGQRLGRERQGQDGRIRRVYFAIDGRGRQIPRQEGESRIDRRLDLLLRHIQAQIQGELKRDDGTPLELVEVIWVRPGIWPSCLSKGAVTEEAMTSGLAPG